MSVDFGLVLVESHPQSHLTKWMDDLDAILPKLQHHFKGLWMTDHLFWGDTYSYEVWTVLAFLAARWPQFDIGPIVMCQSYRNPGLLAKMASTLQVFSGGRLIMGVGAGWKEDEYRGFNYPYPSAGVRVEQLEDTLEILKRLWTQSGQVTYTGKHYCITNAYLEPKPQPIPPLVIGASGNRMMQVVARYADWWNLHDANARKYAERLAVLTQTCDRQGRDPASIRKTWFGRLVTGRQENEIQARATSRAGMPFTAEKAFVGTPSQVVEQISELVALGVDYFMIDVVGLPDPEVVAMLVEDIIPNIH